MRKRKNIPLLEVLVGSTEEQPKPNLKVDRQPKALTTNLKVDKFKTQRTAVIVLLYGQVLLLAANAIVHLILASMSWQAASDSIGSADPVGHPVTTRFIAELKGHATRSHRMHKCSNYTHKGSHDPVALYESVNCHRRTFQAPS